MRLQNELIAAKEREVTLLQRLRVVENDPQAGELNAAKTCPSQPDQLHDQGSQTSEIVANFQANNGTSLDILLNQICANDVQIERLQSDLKLLNEQNRDLLINCESLNEIREQFEDLTKMLAESDNEQNIRIASCYEDIVLIKTKHIQETRKHQFLSEDLAQLSSQLKSQKDHHNKIIQEIRKILVNSENMMPTSDAKGLSLPPDKITEELENELVYIKAKMNRTIESSLNKFVDFESIANIDLKSLPKKGVIQDDLSLNYITKREWFKLSDKCEELEKLNIILDSKRKKLEQILCLAESQVCVEFNRDALIASIVLH